MPVKDLPRELQSAIHVGGDRDIRYVDTADRDNGIADKFGNDNSRAPTFISLDAVV